MDMNHFFVFMLVFVWANFSANAGNPLLASGAAGLVADSCRTYQYRLDGSGEDWREFSNGNNTAVEAISPGRHTLKIRTHDGNGAWNSQEASITFTNTRNWWETWCFGTLAAILAACAIYVAYRIRLQQLQSLNKFRDSIARDLHDEIGSTLSSIHIASRLIQKDEGKNKQSTAKLIDQIVVNSEIALESMNDIVWTLRSDNDRFSDIVNRMRMYGVEILEPLGCKLNFTVSPSVLAVELNLNQRKNLYLLFKEAINNSAKYAGALNCSVVIDQLPDKVILMSIKDNGAGFDPVLRGGAEPPAFHGGNGIRSMQYRAGQLKGNLSISSVPGEGTTILVQFNHGKSY